MCLEVLDKALFVVCLDDSNPETASELCSNMLCELLSAVRIKVLAADLMKRRRRDLQAREGCSGRYLHESVL